jgi:hypothetical protein
VVLAAVLRRDHLQQPCVVLGADPDRVDGDAAVRVPLAKRVPSKSRIE